MALPRLHKQVEKLIVTSEFSLNVNMIVKATSSGKISVSVLMEQEYWLNLLPIFLVDAKTNWIIASQ